MINIEDFFDTEYIKNSISQKTEKGTYLIQELVSANNGLVFPFLICKYFNLDIDLHRDGEKIWEKVEDIKMEAFISLNAFVEEGQLSLEIDEDQYKLNLYFKR